MDIGWDPKANDWCPSKKRGKGGKRETHREEAMARWRQRLE